MREKLLLKTLSGSHAYGLATEDSDIDYRGVYLDPLESIFGLEKSSTISASEDLDDTCYNFKHFMQLVTKCNPNVIELLFMDRKLMHVLDPRFNKFIIANRHRFLSKAGLRSYYGYVRGQLKLVEKDNRPKYSHSGMDCKAAMHVFRLIDQARTIIKEQDIHVRVTPEKRDFLLKVRNGEVFKDYEQFYIQVEAQLSDFQREEQQTDLPETVDRIWINDLMKRFFEACYYEAPDVHR